MNRPDGLPWEREYLAARAAFMALHRAMDAVKTARASTLDKDTERLASSAMESLAKAERQAHLVFKNSSLKYAPALELDL